MIVAEDKIKKVLSLSEDSFSSRFLKFFRSKKDQKKKTIPDELCDYLAKKMDEDYDAKQYILSENISISSENLKLLNDSSKKILKEFLANFEKITKVNKESIEKIINELIDKHKTNFKGIGQPLRIALTGSKFGPGVYDIVLSLEKEEVIKRLKVIK